MTESSEGPDVFISYASEQREEVARPLAELLTGLGVRVWYDRFELKLGDGLREKIDAGLCECRHGVVILSKAFFAKHYTRRELDGLAQREVEGEKVILPIWYDVDDRDVRRFSPPLADRIAAKWENGLINVATEILEVTHPDLLQELTNQYKGKALPRITSGKQLATVIGAPHFAYLENDEPANEAEAELVGDFLQEIRDWGEIWDDIEPGEQVRTEFRLGGLLGDLDRAGWTVYGSRESGRRKVMGLESDWEWANVIVVRGNPKAVFRVDDKFLIIRQPEDAADR
jgi:hypothetical protein